MSQSIRNTTSNNKSNILRSVLNSIFAISIKTRNIYLNLEEKALNLKASILKAAFFFTLLSTFKAVVNIAKSFMHLNLYKLLAENKFVRNFVKPSYVNNGLLNKISNITGKIAYPFVQIGLIFTIPFVTSFVLNIADFVSRVFNDEDGLKSAAICLTNTFISTSMQISAYVLTCAASAVLVNMGVTLVPYAALLIASNIMLAPVELSVEMVSERLIDTYLPMPTEDKNQGSSQIRSNNSRSR